MAGAENTIAAKYCLFSGADAFVHPLMMRLEPGSAEAATPPVVYTGSCGCLPNHLKSFSKSCLTKSQLRRLISLWVGWREGWERRCVLFTAASMELKRSWEVDCHLLQGVSALQLSTEDDVGVEAPFLRLLVLDFFFFLPFHCTHFCPI